MTDSWFQTFAVFWMLYDFFWVIPRRLNFICRRFRTLCLFRLHRQVGACLHAPTCLWRRNRQSVPKHQHIKFRRRGIIQKKAYNRWWMFAIWYIPVVAEWLKTAHCHNPDGYNLSLWWISVLQCSKTCGKGERNRQVVCVEVPANTYPYQGSAIHHWTGHYEEWRSLGRQPRLKPKLLNETEVVVSSAKCDRKRMPKSVRGCIKHCPFSWFEGEWSEVHHGT